MAETQTTADKVSQYLLFAEGDLDETARKLMEEVCDESKRLYKEIRELTRDKISLADEVDRLYSEIDNLYSGAPM